MERFSPGRRMLPILTTLLWLGGAPPAVAEGDCEQLLAEADAAYQTGRFENALGSIEACLETSPPRDYQVTVLALEAKVHLAMDERDAARETIARLLQLDARYAYDPVRDPPIFIRMVDELRVEDTTIKVSSVSKTPESLREAPATVVVVTGEEIERRGYLDLEAVLHDLPGFDISRAAGGAYSNIYQRGLRSDVTNRILFLVDGVEENDLQSNLVLLSRQYPLSNVERVEVIYGPASTMYGANAFVGVVNVLTKGPEQLLADRGRLGGAALLGSGSFATDFLDATLAGRSRSGTLSWTLTGRSYRSDEADLSRYEEWDYDPAVFASAASRDAYSRTLRFAPTPEQSVAGFLAALCTSGGVVDAGCVARLAASPLVTVSPAGIELTEAGVNRVVELDQQAYLREFGGSPVVYSNPTDDWFVQGKLVMPNFELGLQSWLRTEAQTPFHTDLFAPGGDNGFIFSPGQFRIYLKYSRSFGDSLSLTLFSRYKLHELDNTSYLPILRSYLTGGLGLGDLLVDETPATWAGNFFFRSNSQIRNELSVVYSPSSKLTVVSGLELRNSSLQGNSINSTEPDPSETGQAPPIPGGNQFNNRDVGLYAQASWWPLERLKIVAGGRFDNNKIRENGGFGTVFNSRLALVYTRGAWVFKAIHATAFQDATNAQKFIATPGIQIANPTLEPEDVRNLELSAGWQPEDRFSVEVVAYDSSYSNTIQLDRIPCPAGVVCNGDTILQNRGVGSFDIRGIQAGARWKTERLDLYGNYTWTDPVNPDPRGPQGEPLLDAAGNPVGELRVADIASNQLNLGAHVTFRERLGVDLRLNWVDDRRTGPGTTVANPIAGGRVDAFTVAHLTVTYKGLFRHLDLALIANNLFDEEYFHPGVRTADGRVFASRLPQRERHVFLRAKISF